MHWRSPERPKPADVMLAGLCLMAAALAALALLLMAISAASGT